MMYPVKNRFESSTGKSRLLFSFGGVKMTESHKARAPTVLRTGRPNREPLDADEVIAYGLAFAEDLGVSIPKRKRLRRILKRRIPIPQIYQGADYRLWIDRYYIAAQRLADPYSQRASGESADAKTARSSASGFRSADGVRRCTPRHGALSDGLCPASVQFHSGRHGAAESGCGLELRMSILCETRERKSRQAAAI